MPNLHPPTVTQKFMVCLDTLEEAWVFVMDHVDKVVAPTIEISPHWDDDNEDSLALPMYEVPHHYNVVVEGLIKDA